MSTAPFTPGPEGSVIDDQEVTLSGAMELTDEDLDFELTRGQVVEITMRGEIVATREVDKTVSGGREVTVRQWSVKASSLQSLVKIADPAPRKSGDGQIPGQLPISDAGVDGGLSEADEKARANVVPPPEGEVADARRAQQLADNAAAEDAAGRAPGATTLGGAAAEAGTGRVLLTLHDGSDVFHGQRWMNAGGKTFVATATGDASGETVIVGHYEDTGGADSYPLASFNTTLAAIDRFAAAVPPETPLPTPAADRGPATSPDDLEGV